MTGVVPFDFDGQPVRTVGESDEPWFVANDVARILGYSATSAMTRRLDEDEKGVRDLHTPGGEQSMAVINESGLYSAILGSQLEKAKAFRRWVTAVVLPAIRKTGAYAVPQTPEQRMAAAVLEAQQIIAGKDERIAQLEGPAESWEHFASTDGDVSVNEAAKILSRHPGIAIGETRLWKWLDAHRWTYRDGSGSRRAFQDRIDSGHLTTRASGHHHPRTGEWIIDAPQVRVPMKGIELLRKHLSTQLAVVSA